MTKRDIFIFLFKWHRRIIAMFLFIVFLAILIQYLAPQPFSSKAVILVEHNRAPMMRSDISLGLETIDVLNTQVDIILSHTVIANAVDMVKPHKRPSKPSIVKDVKKGVRGFLESIGLADKADKRDNWIRSLADDVKVKALVSSSIIHVEYTDEKPEWASEITNAIVSSYIDHHLTLYRSTGSAEVFKKQMDQLQSQLIEHRLELEKYSQSGDLSSASDQRKGILQQRSFLLERISASENELSELLLRYKPGHEKVKSIKSQLANYQAAVAELQNQLKSVEIGQSETMQLRLNIETEESLFQVYKRRYDEERFKQLANADLINVRVVEYGVAAKRPDHSRLFYIAIAVIGALIFSLGIAFIFEYFDRRITSAQIAEDILGVAELGAIEKL
ncbi:hypothetical protein [Aliiglaciecola sp. LCG003]|uniref:GumC family protein n=1 Tax=Aliiglaciecola sp. LCG003 TaxID=3053655 RepID=UPI00257229CF|nr:hypothetical protein [Aliiglaciecola sp. LCG003]WJG09747.1 hypothetical protein QR722_01530 [Aliiglaciecola sp. LCG003]